MPEHLRPPIHEHHGAAPPDIRIAVTGASGWIGSRVCELARGHGFNVQPLVRSDLADDVVTERFAGSRLAIHTAGLAHTRAREADYERDNVELSVRVAKAARAAGVQRFVLVSTAKVMGDTSQRPFTEEDKPNPGNAYARSKLRAECDVRSLHIPGRFDVVIARPPLVWGPGARANFGALIDAAKSPWPLPLANASALRSMVHIDNLADALLFLGHVPTAAGRVFFVSDNRDISAAALVRALRTGRGRPPRLFSLPTVIWRAADWAGVGRNVHDRIFTAFQIEATQLAALGWRPPVSLENAVVEIGRSAT